MLETPLYGRFAGEDRRLVFEPPRVYLGFVRGTVGVGIAMFLYGAFLEPVWQGPGWWMGTGLAVGVAGVLAALSLHSIVFDLRERQYRIRRGMASFQRGSLDEADALVCIAEPNSRLTAGGVTYHLVLHWKGRARPPLVLQQDTRALPSGAPLASGAAPLLALGARYAAALRVPFYDNAHFPSANPVPLIR